MSQYRVFLRGEDRTEFCIDVEASGYTHAENKAEDLYPEATILEVKSAADLREEADARYDRAQREYEDGYYSDW